MDYAIPILVGAGLFVCGYNIGRWSSAEEIRRLREVLRRQRSLTGKTRPFYLNSRP